MDFGYQAIAEVIKRCEPWKIHLMACMEDNGEIGLDWDEARTFKLSFNVGPTGRIGWAALAGEYHGYGRFWLPEWPDELEKALQLLSEAA